MAGVNPTITRQSESSLESCPRPSVLQSLILELSYLGDKNVALLALNREKPQKRELKGQPHF